MGNINSCTDVVTAKKCRSSKFDELGNRKSKNAQRRTVSKCMDNYRRMIECLIMVVIF